MRERFVPGTAGLAHEHWHRYAFARRVAGKRVLDVACGEGYAAHCWRASQARGDGDRHRRRRVSRRARAMRHLRSLRGRAPSPDASVDAVASFESASAARGPGPYACRRSTQDGVLVMSAPRPGRILDGTDSSQSIPPARTGPRNSLLCSARHFPSSAGSGSDGISAPRSGMKRPAKQSKRGWVTRRGSTRPRPPMYFVVVVCSEYIVVVDEHFGAFTTASSRESTTCHARSCARTIWYASGTPR